MLESGVVLGGRYRLDDRIAGGGMGDVWRGTDVVLGRRVAVKVLLPALLADPDFIARFRAEARMLATLHHPGIVQVYDFGEDELPTGRTDYLVMEYADGEPLSARIRAEGRLSLAETLRVVAQVAHALHAAHQGGIVHRDVKPSNLLVQPDGRVRLLDFGVARSVNITSITSANAVPGTALYMAPEQAAGRPVSAATDIYALGAVAYQCVVGEPPFTGDNPLQVAVKHLHEEAPPLPPEVPASVAALIERALSKDPADRHPDAAALAAAARAAARDPKVAATDAGEGGSTSTPTVVAGVGAVGAGSARRGRKSHTLADNPVVPPSGGRSGEPSSGILALAGIAAVVGLAAAGVTALIAFRLGDRSPATDVAPTPTATESTSVEPSVPADAPVTVSGGQDTAPPRTRENPRPTQSATPTADPDPDAEPTAEPTDSAEPTNPVPTTTQPGPDDPPPTDDPDQG